MSQLSFLLRFEAQVERTPAAIAVSFEGRDLTYRDLDERANRLARYLQAQGIGRDSIVGICVDRVPEAAIAVVGVLKAGAGYLPLDPHYPNDRLHFMCEDSRASFLLRQPGLAPSLAAGTPELALHAEQPVLLVGDATRPERNCDGDSLVYAIYTSGSTGKPKGVAMIHRALDNLIEWQLEDSAAGVGTPTLQFAPLSFDVHFQEMFGTWCSGGRLVLVREEMRLEMLRLLELLSRERVERLFLPFIALQSLADIAVASQALPSALKEVITAGEQLQVTRAIREFFRLIPAARLYNHYGPSETHVVTSLLLEGDPETWPPLPAIGAALPNVSLKVVNEAGEPVARGEEGELFIGGVALGRGYLYREELTAERFVERDGARFYRTGDLAKELPGGIYQFLGRLDGQVKVSGYRVELGEIEVALASHSVVREAAVSVHELRPGDKRLVAYVVLEPGADLASLRDFARKRLPEYMVPSRIIALPSLPRTPSGKVDKRSLPAPTRQRPALALAPVAPRSEMERKLQQLWSDVLSIDDVGVNDNFFDLGGTSLLALRTVADIKRSLNAELPIVQFFEHPTIAEQAQYLVDPSAMAGRGPRRNVNRAGVTQHEPIAVIGVAGRFPGAASVDEFWNQLAAGKDGIQRFTQAELAAVAPEERADPGYVPARGVIEADRFDAGFFGINPNEAAVLDPQQRLLLELSWSALENAGYAPNRTGAVVGVYAGVHNNSYVWNAVAKRPDAVERIGTFTAMVASEKDYVATRIANKLNLTGPALSIHTACSTSLVAIATAVQHLRAGLCEVAIAGGASITVPQHSGHSYQEGGMLSRDGRTRSFDAEATGTVFSDGAGVVVLKPLSAALADGDSVLAVVRGIGLNNDGGDKASFTAPSIEGQAAAIRMAHEDAKISARDVQYVEAHGTATPLGDPIEVEALSAAFSRSTSDQGFCALGSVKSNVGHLTAAAGVAGFIKVVLALQHEELPPSIHFERPNPKIQFEKTPFFVVTRKTPWPRTDKARVAGVSSFGVGGTNAHVVLEEAPLQPASGPSIASQLLLVSARNAAALQRLSKDLARDARSRADNQLPDLAFTLALGRTAFPERRAIVAKTAHEAAEKLAAEDGTRGRVLPSPPSIAFLFPGQGAQYVDMGRNLYEGEALFRLSVDQCAELLQPRLGRDIRGLLYPAADQVESARRELKRTEFTQCALFTIEYSLARMLMAWGIRPAALCGHSVGEFVAACLADVFDLDTALMLVAARGQKMQAVPSGSMLSVRDSAERVLGYLPPELDLAADNAPGLCVVSGPEPDVARFAEQLEARGIAAKLLETSHAFHSRSMDAAAASFAELVASVKLAPPKLPIVSTATGVWLTDAEAQDPNYWASHLRRTVQFTQAAAFLKQDANRWLLEVGPRKTLTTLALQRSEANRSAPVPVAIHCLGDTAEGGAEWTALLAALGRLWVAGVPLDHGAFFRGERRRRLHLPSYSFERDRHWLDVPSSVAAPTRPAMAEPTVTLPIPNVSPPLPEVPSVMPPQNSAGSRRDRLIPQLKELFEHTSGSDFGDASTTANFIELGVDSLLVTQIALRLKQKFQLPITFRQLMEEVPTFEELATYLDQRLPPEAEPAPAAPTTAVAAVTTTVAAQPAAVPLQLAPLAAAIPVLPAAGALGLTQQLLQLQMAQLALLQQQLSLASGTAVALPAPIAVAAPPPVPPAPPAPAAVAAVAPQSTSTSALSADAPIEKQITYDPKKAFGAIARIYQQSDALSPKQQQRLDLLVQRYCDKTAKSKQHTKEHRAHHADPRVVTGFKPRIKELIYPIVTARAQGCRLWDLDGNEYVDALNGFGSNFFGYSAPFIAKTLHAKIDEGFEIGPQTPLAGESAALVCELTGMDRAAFCNTGSEAVMGALRIARTTTGRGLVAAFSGSYHGIFDEVIVRDTKTMRSVPAAPGIMAEAVQNMLVLEYGTEQTLAVLKQRADELAAVLVEPVQSRRPDFRPKQFLEQVRSLTKASGSALIFDEVITGFRIHPRGAQAYYRIDADLTTYGKIVGGGMPIGVIAGRNPWMDALDGGQWQYGDASIPTAGVTYFAGTFVRHPLTMAATHAALSYMKNEGPALQERVNNATTRMADELNQFFKSVGAPLEIRHFASLWKTFFTEPQPYGELLFCYLRDRGVHIWDGFPCFLTLAHGQAEIDFIVAAFKSAVREMQSGDFLPGEEVRSFDASKPPTPDARLGRDPSGNPAWFVPNPDAPGKYLQVS